VKDSKTAFESASRQRRPGMLRELVYFLRQNKKWWLIPILFVIAVLAALCFFAGTGAAPFIYTIF
jgi:hypothetical protein